MPMQKFKFNELLQDCGSSWDMPCMPSEHEEGEEDFHSVGHTNFISGLVEEPAKHIVFSLLHYFIPVSCKSI